MEAAILATALPNKICFSPLERLHSGQENIYHHQNVVGNGAVLLDLREEPDLSQQHKLSGRVANNFSNVKM